MAEQHSKRNPILQVVAIFALASVTISVTGCYTTSNTARIEREAAARPAQPSVDELRSHTFSAPSGVVFDAIAAQMFDDGMVPEVMDRPSGIISSGWNSGGGALLVALVGNYRHRHSFMVRPAGTDSSRVTYTLSLEMASGAQWTPVSPSRRNYSHIAAYWQALEGRLK